MKASTGSGKGSGPRSGQYSKKSQTAFEEAHERIYGKECSPCRGRGYTWDFDKHNNMKKHTCAACKGTGRIKDGKQTDTRKS
jgi:DnaJ-class molecular chaperone